MRGPLACATYTQMLKLACDAFSKDYFSEHYRALEEADYAAISREDYLKELERLDIEVGKKNNLGEIKSFVLLQVLSVMLGEQIYVFCSDDKNARNGAANFEDVRCISLVSLFSRLKEESNWTLADAEPYIESLIAFYQAHHQTTFRILFTFRDLAGFFAKPYDRIIETADNNTVGYAPFFVRQTALPAGSNKLHPLFIRAMDSSFHGSPPRGRECSELLQSTIMEKNATESQISDI